MNNMMKFFRKFIFFFVFSTLLSQDYPYWLRQQFDDENQLEIIGDIESFSSEKIDLKAISFRRLSEQFYFVPDSILRLWKAGRLKEEDQEFLKQFDRNYSRLSQEHYSISRHKLSIDSTRKNLLGNSHILKSYHQLRFNNYRLNYSAQKLQYENYHLNHSFLLRGEFGKLKLHLGRFKLSGINPLVFATSYGQFFYENTPFLSARNVRISAQSSINSHNVLKGFALSYAISESSSLHYAYGKETYFVSSQAEGFTSINYYQPEIEAEQFASKVRLSEENHLVNLSFPFMKQFYALSFLNTHFSKPFLRENDYEKRRFTDLNYLGLKQNYTLKNLEFSVTSAFLLKGNAAHQFQANYKEKNDSFSVAYTNYHPQFVNFKSNAFLSSAARAENEKAFMFLYQKKWHSLLHSAFGFRTKGEIRSLKREEEREKSKSIFFYLSGRFKSFSYRFKFSESTEARYQFYFRYRLKRALFLSNKFYFYHHWKSVYALYQLDYKEHKLALGHSNARKTISVYKTGLYREFLIDYFKQKQIFLILKSKIRFSDHFKLQAIYNAYYLLKDEEFLDSNVYIASKWKQELAFSLNYAF